MFFVVQVVTERKKKIVGECDDGGSVIERMTRLSEKVAEVTKTLTLNGRLSLHVCPIVQTSTWPSSSASSTPPSTTRAPSRRRSTTMLVDMTCLRMRFQLHCLCTAIIGQCHAEMRESAAAWVEHSRASMSLCQQLKALLTVVTALAHDKRPF